MGKIKEVNVTASYAWSPRSVHPIYIAAGTAAAVDASFSSNAKLEVYEIDVASGDLSVPCVGSVETGDRFHKVAWGNPGGDAAKGVVVCGTDNGGLQVYNPDKIVNGADPAECLMWSTDKHTGSVRALDFNIHQSNLIASGADESEIFIWDLKNPNAPMTPGAKIQPSASVNSLAWNKQVQHILASTSASANGPSCVVWDLKKNQPVIKVHDPSGRMQCSDVAWHPQIATQLALSSQLDHSPVVQLWDLRYASSPVRVFDKHTKGVAKLAWCNQDPDLLMSCSKTNEVFCWNPNSAPSETVYELQTNSHWSFDVQWCPRDPTIISCGSFDGQISCYSLMNGGFHAEDAANDKQRDALMESFGADFSVAPAESPQPQKTATKVVGTPLTKTPKWMRKPCGVSFAFGGRLISFGEENQAPVAGQAQQPAKREVHISQVVTEEALLRRSQELRAALADKSNCQEYCSKKVTESQNELETDIWNFLLVNFEQNPRSKYLELLGYEAADLKSKFQTHLSASKQPEAPTPPVENEVVSSPVEPVADVIEPPAADAAIETPVAEEAPVEPAATEAPVIGAETPVVADEAPVVGNETPVVDPSDFFTDENLAAVPDNTMFGADNSAAADQFEAAVIQNQFAAEQPPQVPEETPAEEQPVEQPSVAADEPEPAIEAVESKMEELSVAEDAGIMAIPTVGDLDSLISQALLIGDYEVAVELCVDGGRMTDAIVIAKAGGEQLYEKTQQRYFRNSTSKISRLLSAVVTKDWSDVVKSCDLSNWKEAFAALLTYASDDDLRKLCDELGSRLENDATTRKHAVLCYLCSGNIKRLAKVWNDLCADGIVNLNGDDTDQDFVEILMILTHVLGEKASYGEITAEKLTRYATLLADQGQFAGALEILPTVCTEASILVLRDRLQRATQVDEQEAEEVQPAAAVEPAAAAATNQTEQVVQQSAQQVVQPEPAAPAATQQAAPANPYAFKRSLRRPNYQGGEPAAMQPMAPMQPAPMQPAPMAPMQPAPMQPAPMAPMQPAPMQPAPMVPAFTPAVQPVSTFQPVQTSAPVAPLAPTAAPGVQPSIAPVAPMQRRPAGWNDPPPINPNRVKKKKAPTVNQPFAMPQNIMTPQAPVQQPQGLSMYRPQPGLSNQPPGQMMRPAAAAHHPNPSPGGVPQAQQEPALMQKISNNGSYHQQGRDECVVEQNGKASGEEQNNGHVVADAEVSKIQQQQKFKQIKPESEANCASVPTGALRGAVKPPIPAEHEILQTSFNELITKCEAKAQSAQHKRKLTDCSRRIEFLYDKLRSQSLSATIIAGLHLVAQAIQNRDYTTGINQHIASIVRSSNFSEISAFMPGLKSMLQIAQQLRV